MKSNLNFFEKGFKKLINLKPYIKQTVRRLIDKKKIGSFEFRYSINSLKRMHYAYIVFNAAKLAKKLNLKSISVIEFGVANGRGFLLLEYYSKEIEKLLDINIEIYRFDMGTGLPNPSGHKDPPYQWKKVFLKWTKKILRKD